MFEFNYVLVPNPLFMLNLSFLRLETGVLVLNFILKKDFCSRLVDDLVPTKKKKKYCLVFEYN